MEIILALLLGLVILPSANAQIVGPVDNGAPSAAVIAGTYVPYTGATGAVTLGSQALTAGSITGSSLTVTGNAFSVGGSTFNVISGKAILGDYTSFAYVGVGGARGEMNFHAFEDNTVVDVDADTANQGYAAFDAKPTLQGSNNVDHLRGFQSRPIFDGAGLVTNLGSITSQPKHTGAGIISSLAGVKVYDTEGTGQINYNFGVFIDTMTRGTQSNYGLFVNGGTDYLYGPVGIGNQLPAYKLDVTGDGHFTSTVTVDTGLYVAGSTLTVAGGKVSIGKTSPAYRLYSSDTSATNAYPLGINNSQAVGANICTGIQFTGQTTDNAIGNIRSCWSGGATTDGAYLAIDTRNTSGTSTEKLRINESGNVSIVTGDIGLAPFTTVALSTRTPSKAGALVFNSDKAEVCYSSGTAAGSWILIKDASTSCDE